MRKKQNHILPIHHILPIYHILPINPFRSGPYLCPPRRGASILLFFRA